MSSNANLRDDDVSKQSSGNLPVGSTTAAGSDAGKRRKASDGERRQSPCARARDPARNPAQQAGLNTRLAKSASLSST